jgi:rubredoxin
MKSKPSEWANDPDYYTCPKCEPQIGLTWFGTDVQGPVYQCPGCGQKFDQSELDAMALERRTRD